jgi:hypothetical protein
MKGWSGSYPKSWSGSYRMPYSRRFDLNKRSSPHGERIVRAAASRAALKDCQETQRRRREKRCVTSQAIFRRMPRTMRARPAGKRDSATMEQ